MTMAHRSLARPVSTNLNRHRPNIAEGRVSDTLKRADALQESGGAHASTLCISWAESLTMLLTDLAQAAQDRPLVALAIVGLLLALVLKAAASSELKHPESLPWIGKDNTKSFAVTRATWLSVSNAKQWLAEGYQKVRKHSHVIPIREPNLNAVCNSIRKRANLTSSRIYLDDTKL